MSEFVDECRREWRRLGVPDSLANEMASDLDADLADANADGVALPEIVGDGDPLRFARDWAVARGLVPEERSERPHLRTLWRLVAVAVAIVVLAAGLTALVLALTRTGSSPARSGKTVSLPLVVGMKEQEAATVLEGRGLRLRVVLVKTGRAGYVLAQSPAPGALVVRGSAVRLQIGRGG